MDPDPQPPDKPPSVWNQADPRMQLIYWVLHDSRLSLPAKNVYIALIIDLPPGHHSVRTSQLTLNRRLKIHIRRRIVPAISELVQAGWISQSIRPSHYGHHAFSYQFSFAKPPGYSPSKPVRLIRRTPKPTTHCQPPVADDK